MHYHYRFLKISLNYHKFWYVSKIRKITLCIKNYHCIAYRFCKSTSKVLIYNFLMFCRMFQNNSKFRYVIKVNRIQLYIKHHRCLVHRFLQSFIDFFSMSRVWIVKLYWRKVFLAFLLKNHKQSCKCLVFVWAVIHGIYLLSIIVSAFDLF